MRLTISLLGTELFSVELSRNDPEEVAEDEPEEPGGATGGQFELGFRPPRPSWAVIPGEQAE